jgi:peroxiredoxin (alkyl hydroperoxide reductase subunit C)
MGFAKIQPELKKRGVELLGLSVDSITSHIAWARNIEEKTGVKINFPIIADLNKEVSAVFGMVHPGQSKTETVRAVFVIDQSGDQTDSLLPTDHRANMTRVSGVTPADVRCQRPLHSANWRPGDM